jgi:hypothetical protein
VFLQHVDRRIKNVVTADADMAYYAEELENAELGATQ